MAGDWMKIELELPDKPEVHSMASILNLDPDAIVGKLIRIWQWFDKHTTDGNAYGVTFSLPDRISGVTGFGDAMMFVGWLEQNDKNLTMPKFDRHTSASAKTRAQTAKRVAKTRGLECNAVAVTETLPEKRREEKRKTTTVSEYSDEFEQFWKVYPKKTGKGEACKSWNKQNPSLQTVLNSLEWQIKSSDWKKENGQYIPMPSTYLNQRRFDDESPNGQNTGKFDVNQFMKAQS